MFKKTKLLIFTFTLFATFFTNAHVQKLTKASFSLKENNQYELVYHVDLVHILAPHILKNKTKQSYNDDVIVNKIKTMTITELLKTLTTIKEDIKKGTSLSIDQKLVILKDFQGPTVGEVKNIIENPVGDQGYPIVYIAKGKLLTKPDSVKIRLPQLLGDALLTVSKPQQFIVTQGEESAAIQLTNSLPPTSKITQTISTFSIYIYQGFVHIIPKGLDHILFVLALFLLTAKFSTLLWQVSAFTLAHTITLALGIFGVVNISADIVEPLIALSIAYVAIENIYAKKLKKWRIVVIFVFGLLHGLGFASVLLDLGLAPSQYIVSLIAFNVGVEVAQVTVLLIALLCLYRFQHKPWYRQRVIQPLSILIAIVGLYWFFERII